MYRASPNLPCDLQTLCGAPISIVLRELRIDDVIEAELELTGDAYARCLDEGQLGLDAPGRGPGPEPLLTEQIRIVARLRPHLADLVGREPDPMHALLERLFTTRELAHADAWRAHDVTQDAGVEGLSVGYRTAWAIATDGQ